MANRVLIIAAGSAGTRCIRRGMQILDRLHEPPSVTVVSCLDGPGARGGALGPNCERSFTHISPKPAGGAPAQAWIDTSLQALVVEAVQDLIIVDDGAALVRLSLLFAADQAECEGIWGEGFVSRWTEAVVSAVAEAAPQTAKTVGFRTAVVTLGDPCNPGTPLTGNSPKDRWSDFRVPTKTIAGEYSPGDAEETASLLLSLLLTTSGDTHALPGVDEGNNTQVYAVWTRAVEAAPIEEHRHLAAALARLALERAHHDRRTTQSPTLSSMQAAPGEVLNPNLREHGRTLALRVRAEFGDTFAVPDEEVAELDLVRQWTADDRLEEVRAWLSAREVTAAHESAAWYAQEYVPKAAELVRTWERDLRDVLRGHRQVAVDEATAQVSPSLPATLSVVRGVRADDNRMAEAARREAASVRLTPLSFDVLRVAQSGLMSAVESLPIESRVRLWPWLIAGVTSLLLSPIIFELAAYFQPSPYGLAGGWWANVVYWITRAASIALGPPVGPVVIWLITGASLSLVARRRWRAARQHLREFLNPQQGRFAVAVTDLVDGARGSVAARVIGGIRHHAAQLRADVHQRRADGWGSVVERLESLDAHLVWLETELAVRVGLRTSGVGAVREQLVTCGSAQGALEKLRGANPDPVERLLRKLAPPAAPANVDRWLQPDQVIDEAVQLMGGDLPKPDEQQMSADLDRSLSSIEVPPFIVHCDAREIESPKASIWHIAATEVLATRLRQFSATPPIRFVQGEGAGFTVVVLALQPLGARAPGRPASRGGGA